MTFDQIADAIVETLKSALPDLYQCKVYEGEFESQGHHSINPPAVFVVPLGGVPSEADTGQIELSCRFIAYVVVDHAGTAADLTRTALGWVEAVAHVIQSNRWGLEGNSIGAAKLTRIENVSNRLEQGRALGLWTVNWEQRLRLGPDQWADDGDTPPEVYFTHSDEIGTDHETNYEAIE